MCAKSLLCRVQCSNVVSFENINHSTDPFSIPSLTQSLSTHTHIRPTRYSFTRSPTLTYSFTHSITVTHTHTLEHRYDTDRAHFIYVDDVIQGRMNPYRLAGHEYEKACVFQLRLNATSSSIKNSTRRKG